MRVELGEAGAEVVELAAGQPLRVEPGVRVRYANPFAEAGEHYPLCVPAFAPDTAHREE